jgi:hypothetical protein
VCEYRCAVVYRYYIVYLTYKNFNASNLNTISVVTITNSFSKIKIKKKKNKPISIKTMGNVNGKSIRIKSCFTALDRHVKVSVYFTLLI